MGISRDQCQVENVSGCGKEPVNRVRMFQGQLFRGEYDLTRERRLSQMTRGIPNPVAQITVDGYSASAFENECFPDADWG